MQKLLEEERWTKYGEQIRAWSGRSVAKSCDHDGPMAAAIRAIDVHGSRAAEAEEPLRAIAARYANYTDVLPAVAAASKRISGRGRWAGRTLSSRGRHL
jgi:hypothetical protein